MPDSMLSSFGLFSPCSGLPHFAIRAGKYTSGQLRVVRFRGNERVNAPFLYDVTIASSLAYQDVKSEIYGKPVRLSMQTAARATRVEGIVATFSAVRVSERQGGTHDYWYRVTIVPRLHLLSKRTAHRVFEDMSLLDIILVVLGDVQITPEVRLDPTQYRRVPFMYQSGETDLEFVDRLFALAGVTYFFEHPLGDANDFPDRTPLSPPTSGDSPVTDEGRNEDEVMVLVDTAARMTALDGTNSLDGTSAAGGLAYDPHSGHGIAQESVSFFEAKDEIGPSQLSVREWNSFDHAATEQTALFDASTFSAEAALSVVEYQRDGAFLTAVETSDKAIIAERSLAQLRRGTSSASGKSDCRRLAPGYRFTLGTDTHAHAIKALNADYYVTSVLSEGVNPEELDDGESHDVYSNTFECSPVALEPRPAKPREFPRRAGESALVIGTETQPDGVPESDERGRLRVRFRWGHRADPKQPPPRLGTTGECCVQWLERWAGDGYGTWTLPRVGSEVWVEFPAQEGGSPIATGQLYSQQNVPPFGSVASSDTFKVGIRSQSLSATDGSITGYSEISIDDSPYNPTVRVIAQQDMGTLVGRDSSQVVRGDADMRVDGTFRQAAGRDLGQGAHRDRSISVGRNDSESVTGTKLSVVTGDRFERTHGDVVIAAAADLDVSVHQSRRASVTGDDRVEVNGVHTLIVKQKSYESIGESRVTVIGAHGTDDARNDLTVWGDATVMASGTVSLNAAKGIELRCGNSAIELTPSGIVLRSDSLQLVASTMTLKAKDLTVGANNGATISSQKVTLQASGSQLQLSSGASLTGGSVSLGSGSGNSNSDNSDSTNATTQKLSLVLKNSFGQGLSRKKYALLCGGKKIEGTTGDDGKIEADVDQSATEAALTIWTDTYPEGPTRQYVVDVGTIPPVSDPKGAQIRLSHLSYYGGAITGKLDRQTSAALAKFQADHSKDGLKVTGVLDSATQSQLQKTHGS